MNIKIYLLGIFTFLSFSAFAQAEKSVSVSTDHSVTALKISAGSLEELEAFDWKSVYEIFESNEAGQTITLQVGFEQELALDSSNIENWSVTLSGKTSELESMIGKAKKIVANMGAMRSN